MGTSLTNPASRQSGAALVSVLVAAALLAIIASVTMVVARQSSIAKKAVSAGEASQEVEEVVANMVVTQINSYLAGRCPGGLNISGPIGTLGNLSQTRFISLPPGAPPDQVAAAGRCRSPQVPTANSTSPIYLCATLTGHGGENNENLLSSKTAFAEFHYSPQNLRQGWQTTSPIPCQAIANKAGMGGVLNYTVYWSLKTSSSSVIYRHKDGAVYVPAP